MIINRTVAAIAAALMLAGASAAAHHAFSAEFDQDKPVNLEGTLTRMPLMSVLVMSIRFFSLPSKHAYSIGT